MHIEGKIALYEFCREKYGREYRNLTAVWKAKVKAVFFRKKIKVKKKKL